MKGLFILRSVHVSDDVITSSLSVVAFPGLNLAVIECVDGSESKAEGQHAIAKVASEIFNTCLKFKAGGVEVQ